MEWKQDGPLTTTYSDVVGPVLYTSIDLSGHLALQLDCERGTIVSRSTMLLRSTVGPHRRAQYLWTISYQMLNASGRWNTQTLHT